MIEKTRLELLEVLAELSEQFPEFHLGQLINNLATFSKGPQVEAIWDAEDKELLEAAKKTTGSISILLLRNSLKCKAGRK